MINSPSVYYTQRIKRTLEFGLFQEGLSIICDKRQSFENLLPVAMQLNIQPLELISYCLNKMEICLFYAGNI